MNPETIDQLTALLQQLGEEQFTTLMQQVQSVRKNTATAGVPSGVAGGGAGGAMPMESQGYDSVRVAMKGRLGGMSPAAQTPMPFPGVGQGVPVQTNTQAKLADVLSGDPELAAIYQEIVAANPTLGQMINERLGQRASPAMDQTMSLGGAAAVSGLESRGVAPYPLGDAMMGPMQGGLPPGPPMAQRPGPMPAPMPARPVPGGMPPPRGGM